MCNTKCAYKKKKREEKNYYEQFFGEKITIDNRFLLHK